MKNAVKHGKYFEDADVVRGFAILLVVLGHAVAKENIYTSENVFCNILYNYIYSFHMPLFFIVSGFVFSVKDRFREHVWHIFRSLLVPYVLFNLFTILLQKMLPFFSIEERTISEQIKVMVLNGGNLWFIYVLIEFRLLFYLIDKIIDSMIKRGVIVFLLFLILATIKISGPPYFLFGSFRLYAPFFMMGYFIKLIIEKNEVRMTASKKKTIGTFCLLLSFLLFYCKENFAEHIPYSFTIYFPTALAGCGACYFLITSISNIKVRNTLVALGRTSFQIYIFNGYFISVSRTMLSSILHVNVVALLAVMNFIAGLIPNYYFSCMILKFRVIREIFGKKRI